jgi:hypothetical protein
MYSFSEGRKNALRSCRMSVFGICLKSFGKTLKDGAWQLVRPKGPVPSLKVGHAIHHGLDEVFYYIFNSHVHREIHF